MIDFYIELIEDLREIAADEEGEQYAEKITAPSWMKSAVKRGKKIREKQPDSNKCCTATGLRRANQIENGETLSQSTIKRMKSFASRHGAQADWNDPESKNAQAMMIWGIPYSKSGLDKFLAWCDRNIKDDD